MEIQSGFVLAVVIAAVLLVDRLGGTEELGRRLFQVVLGAMLFAAVFAFTDAFIAPDAESTQSAFGDVEDEDAADRFILSSTIQVGAGVLLVMLGLAGMGSRTTIPLGLLLGGALLVLASGGGGGISFAFIPTLAFASLSSQEADIARLVVFAALVGALLWFGYQRWESTGASGEASDTSEM